MSSADRILALGLLAALAAAAPAAAQSLDPVAQVLINIKNALTGPVGRAIAVIGLILIGYAFYIGRLNWIFLAAWLIGTTFVFFADEIVEGFA